MKISQLKLRSEKFDDDDDDDDNNNIQTWYIQLVCTLWDPMHHVCILNIGLNMVHWNRNLLPTVY